MSSEEKVRSSELLDLATKSEVDIIKQICRDLVVERLFVFGSAAAGKQGADSDLDFLVKFDRRSGPLFARFFNLKHRLEQILGRDVDLVLEDSIKNPFFRESVNQNKVLVYDDRS